MVPSNFSFLTDEVVSVNGSSAKGLCLSVSENGNMTTCTDPTSSVLFDGNVPTLAGLDGDMWASQLLTLQTISSSTEISFDFTAIPDYTGVTRVEVVIFNCPNRGVSVAAISLNELSANSNRMLSAQLMDIAITSCDYLVRVCLDTNATLPVLSIEFELDGGSDQVYIAETIFYDSNVSCPDSVTILDDTTTVMSPTTPITELQSPATNTDLILSTTVESTGM